MQGRKRIALVTGGAGRLGRALTARLIEEGIETRVLVRREEDASRIAPGAIPYVGSIDDVPALEMACSGAENVFHMAAIVSEYRLGASSIMRTNVIGTRKLLAAARDAKVARLFYPSSANVYGRVRKELLDEESALKPSDTYGLSKSMAEKEIVESKVGYTIFRLATIYGPGFENSFFRVLKAVRDGKAYIMGDGKNRLAMVHVNDAVNAFVLAAGKKGSINKIYNVGDGREYTQEYLLDLAADLLGVARPQSHINKLAAGILAKAKGLDRDEIRFMTSDRKLDISRARKELGFRPVESVESGSRYILGRFLREKA